MKLERLMAFGVYGCVGITTEVFFTAFYPFFADGYSSELMGLRGHSYVWMYLIYGSASVLFPFGFRIMNKRHLLIRALAYGLAILGVELVSGAMLRALLGACPWEYQEGWHFDGLIRYDYLPLWMVFGLGLEGIHRFNKRVGFA